MNNVNTTASCTCRHFGCSCPEFQEQTSKLAKNTSLCNACNHPLNQHQPKGYVKPVPVEPQILIPSVSIKSRLLISGYLRNIHNNNELSFEIPINMTHTYYKAPNSKYIDILISKEQNKHLGAESSTNNHPKFDISSDWYFDANQCCLHCSNINCLQFIANYKNPEWITDIGLDSYDKNSDIKTNTWYNNCNEYKCNICEYFIGINIKCKFIEFHNKYTEDDTNRYSTSIRPSQRKNLQKIIKKTMQNDSKTNKCIECQKDMEIVQRKEVNYAYQGWQWTFVDYCNECQLVRTWFKDSWDKYD
eukprot:186837_1